MMNTWEAIEFVQRFDFTDNWYDSLNDVYDTGLPTEMMLNYLDLISDYDHE